MRPEPKHRELAHVPRWVIVRTIQKQSVAEHAFFVTRYAIDIAHAIGLSIGPDFIANCLRHDDDELHTGDIPSPFKKKISMGHGYPPMPTQEQFVLKAADLLEAILFLVDEMLLGNKVVVSVHDQLNDELRSFCQGVTLDGEPDISLWSWIEKVIWDHTKYRGRLK